MVSSAISAAIIVVLGFEASCHGKQKTLMDDPAGFFRILCWAQENKTPAIYGLEIDYLSQAD